MDIGALLYFDGSEGNSLDNCVRAARAVEEAGFAQLWHGDHVVYFDTYEPRYPYSPDGRPPVGERQGIYSSLFALAAAASVTSSIRVGTSVMVLPLRNPVVLAQEVVSLDHLSGGRLDLGVGVGWSTEEFAAVGVPFERRGRRAEEYIEAMTRLWTDYPAAYSGEFVRFKDVVAFPKPLQQPRVPVLLGGQSPVALRRAARFGDGWMSWMLPVTELGSAFAVLDEERRRAGRDHEDFRRILMIMYTTPDDLRAYLDAAADLGADQVAIAPWTPDRDLSETLDEIAQVSGLDGRIVGAALGGDLGHSHDFRTSR